MDILERLNAGIAHIEQNLTGETPVEEAARLACTSKDSFLRFFSYMTGMTLVEYVRRRRLTLAADALRETDEKVIDLALRFGYDSADAFSRAFRRQHGVSPAEYRKNGGAIRIYPPASFHILIKGAKEMDFRIMELEEHRVMGLAKPYDTAKYRTREALRHEMWADSLDDVPGKITTGRWNEPGSSKMDGVWYGIWQGGAYMIAREQADAPGEGLTAYTIPAGRYAAFRTEKGGVAWEEFPPTLFSGV